MDRLKYSSTERMYEGVIVKITDGSVTIDLKGRLGQFKMPMRMLISDYELKLGMEVGFLLSYPEVLGPEVNEKYAEVIAENQRREQEKNK
ncbi:CBO2463/CBO2479 domain-containing protein [Tepidibacter hydrothermalis]|uniref:CBO2463/CBO2479 domain-containing protein n=1 Tax=Tepidibacter hydrothermalis TaxID=3036126 RepID=A0ABY8EE76_9FIRM|nr:CBO2463/CBO2479 domain-containing protein [Tepidibacter hydrothermalis]WFD11242.1 CBO2463/CBO2479 domain-containing protein [Tepidibacter hydrothermalis]